MEKLLFVCLGNICRSPAAEAIMQKLVDENGLEDRVQVDSAGTSGLHQGRMADPRMRKHGERRGFDLSSRSRPFSVDDFDQFDHIFCMDHSNFQNVSSMARNPQDREKIHMMCDYAQNFQDQEVPDPYYGGADGFEYVFDLLEDACEGAYKYFLRKK